MSSRSACHVLDSKCVNQNIVPRRSCRFYDSSDAWIGVRTSVSGHGFVGFVIYLSRVAWALSLVCSHAQRGCAFCFPH
eukprot:6455632-Amphidinium_carterae.1